MDDAKIDLIAREVLSSLRKTHAPEFRAAPSAPTRAEPASVPLHPSMQLLSVAGGVVGSPCIIEPDQVCVGSFRCRTFGH